VKRVSLVLWALLWAVVPKADAVSARSSEKQVNDQASGTARALAPERLVILKVDGLNADLLRETMEKKNPATGKSLLPWFDEIFNRHGTIFDNFFTRGISLSAPSWSLLDTGHHLLIKGNVEYDRYTGRVYDYLNFFPFYVGYARSQAVDMPSVQVLDEAGIPLLIDAFPYRESYQSFQLFQRGVRWVTLRHSFTRRLSTRALLSVLEDPQAGLGLGEGLAKETESEVTRALDDPQVEYADLFTGDIDHVAHSINDRKMLDQELIALDALAGRLWNAIQASPEAARTLFVVVSDHGMNNVPGVYSQTFSLPDLLNSRAGGAHHVVTNRHQLSDYKVAGLDPLVFRVINPSASPFYLGGQANNYPTAWLDLDGNEQAAVGLRNSELNRIHIVLSQLARPDLAAPIRQAAARYFKKLIEEKRPEWTATMAGLSEELNALQVAIKTQQEDKKIREKKRTKEDHEQGADKKARRAVAQVSRWIQEREKYEDYLAHLRALLAFEPSGTEVLRRKITDLVPPMSLGDPNRVYDLQNYVIGPAEEGLAIDDKTGEIDQQRSFRYLDYFSLLASQVVRNNTQNALSPRPIDFVAMALPAAAVRAKLNDNRISEAAWLYRDEEHQLIECIDRNGDSMSIRVLPVAHLKGNPSDELTWDQAGWRAGFPLALFEDSGLAVPDGQWKETWLNDWHSEREWADAVRDCRYSNGVIGITEELIAPRFAMPQKVAGTLLDRLEVRRRDLVQADFHVFAADHWNFNVRNFNPGGNHGSFLRISTHSVWMMAGAGVPSAKRIEKAYDSLNFASTVLQLLGKPVPMADRVVSVVE
jgi:hypothetical protein